MCILFKVSIAIMSQKYKKYKKRKIPTMKKKIILSSVARKIISIHIKQQSKVIRKKVSTIMKNCERLEKMFALELFNHHRKLNYLEEQHAVFKHNIFSTNLKILSMLSVQCEREKQILSKNKSYAEVVLNSILQQMTLLRDKVQPAETAPAAASATTTAQMSVVNAEFTKKKKLYIIENNGSNKYYYRICASCYINPIYMSISRTFCKLCDTCANLVPVID